jgi:hypothetical protein
MVLLKVEGSTSAFKRGDLDYGRECFMEANIDNQSKLFSDNYIWTQFLQNIKFSKTFYRCQNIQIHGYRLMPWPVL